MSNPSERDAGSAVHQLESLRTTLGAIGALIGSVSLTAGAAAQASAVVQKQAEQAHRTIERAVQMVQDGGHRHGPHFRVIDRAADVEDVVVRHAVLPPHGPLAVIVDVQASAQLAGLLLSFGTWELPRTLSLLVYGNRGATEITILSGATLAELRNVFLSIAPLTGVEPSFGGEAGIVLRAEQVGADGFVQVEVLNNFTAPGAAGIYGFEPHDFYEPDPSRRSTFYRGADESDFGQDLRASINGTPAAVDGLSISVDTPRLRVGMTLDLDVWPYHALTLGSFQAFRVLRD